MSHAIVRNVIPQTGIDMCVEASFMSSGCTNLVVAKGRMFEVYAFTPDAGAGKCLSLVYSELLWGRIESLAVISMGAYSSDCLILGFGDAKATIIDFNPDQYCLRTRSMHCFENLPRNLTEGYSRRQLAFQIRVDPINRCAAMPVFDRNLAIVPLIGTDVDVGLNVSRLDAPFTKTSPSDGSYVLPLSAFEARHMKDFALLHGYYMPTLLILHQPEEVWHGRASLKSNTCRLTAITLNIPQKQHPIIWQKQGLPYDCSRIVPVPGEIGGALILSANALLYVNQRDIYGMSLNGFGPDEAEAPCRLEPAPFVFSLEESHHCFITDDRVLFSLIGGELVLAQLVFDTRSLQRIELTKVGGGVLASDMCLLSSNHLFLASNLGDSQVIKFEEAGNAQNGAAVPDPNKRRRVVKQEYDPMSFMDDSGSSESEGELGTIEDLLLSDARRNMPTQANYRFAVADSLFCFSPVTDMLTGPSIDTASKSLVKTSKLRKQHAELFCAVGYEKNAAIAIIQQCVRPQLFSSFRAPECIRVWTVHKKAWERTKRKHNEMVTQQEDDIYHSFLAFSTHSKSKVYRMALNNLKNVTSKVSVQKEVETVHMGEVCNQKYVIQVTSMQVVCQSRKSAWSTINFNNPIARSRTLDPFSLVLFDNGTMNVIKWDEDGQMTNSEVDSSAHAVERRQESGDQIKQEIKQEQDDLISGQMLFGDDEDEDESKSIEHKLFGSSQVDEEVNFETNFYCVVVRQNGTLEIWKLPEREVVFTAFDFAYGPAVLRDKSDASQTNVPTYKITRRAFRSAREAPTTPVVTDVCLHYIGPGNQFLLIGILNTGDLLLYRSFSHDGRLRFSRVAHGFVRRLPLRRRGRRQQSDEVTKDIDEIEPLDALFPIYNGDTPAIIVAGDRPAIILCVRGYPRVFQLGVDGEVTFASPFRTAATPRGFVLCNSAGDMQVCQVTQYMKYDCPWPIYKRQLRKPGSVVTVHHVAYHEQAKRHIAIVSFLKKIQDPELLQTGGENGCGGFLPRDRQFQIQVLNGARGWAMEDYLNLNDEEHVLSVGIHNISVKQEGEKYREPYLLVGTGMARGEDVSTRGRLLIYDISDELEPGQFKILEKFAKDEKIMITKVNEIDGYILTAQGSKILLYNFESRDELVPTAFFDASIYISTLKIIRNYLLIGDIYKSVHLVMWRDITRSLTLLAKDNTPLHVAAADFIINDDELGLVVADEAQNIQLFQYKPTTAESRDGQMLIPAASIHTGERIGPSVRLRMHTPKSLEESPMLANVFGTYSGGMGVVSPVEEQMYRRLLTLQLCMNTGLPHTAGLSPRGFGLHRYGRRVPSLNPKPILDGDLLWRFLSLDSRVQDKFAQQIGTTSKQIIDNLLKVDLSTSFF